VSVHAFGANGQITPDGLFDVAGGTESWQEAALSVAESVLIVDELTDPIARGLSDVHRRFCIVDGRTLAEGDWPRLLSAGHPLQSLHPYVPVSDLATRDRHHGFGFTGYELVLGGVSEPRDDPPPAVRWITAAFRSTNVILVADGTATAWRGRALRGRTPVESRMDLWRLIAHANVCIDLDPGPIIARECIEALRFGTPIIVPEGSTAARIHVQAGGGLAFSDPWELIDAVATLREEKMRGAASESGRHYADTRYGDPLSFVESVNNLLRSA